jgi:uncharacterized Zn finger protein
VTPLPFDEAYVEGRTTPKVYPRGVEYAADGHVLDLVRRGDTLFARVAGTEWEPYHIRIRLDEADEGEPVAEAVCTCPYEWGGWCKHVVAALLEALNEPELIEERPPLAETLAGLKRDRLAKLLQQLAEAHPALVDEIEAFAGLPSREPRSPDDWERWGYER